MVHIERSVRLAASAGEVWALVGPFDGLPNWHPAVLSSTVAEEGERLLRRLKVVGGIGLEERLVSHDDDAMTCRWVLVEGPLPVADYSATLTVLDHGNGSATVVWQASFEAAGAPEEVVREALEGIYDSGLNSLADRFGLAP